MSDSGRPQRLVFGEVAELYHRLRPGYPPAVFDAVGDFAQMVAGSAVLEVGAGTGKATGPLLERGWRVLALEPSQEMAEVVRREFGSDSRLELVEQGFEAWDPGSRRFQVVCSAQAWHWVDQSVGLAKAARVLAPRGCMALMWNRPEGGDRDLRGRIDDIYRRLAPEISSRTPGERKVDRRVGIDASGLFEPAELVRIPWERSYSAVDYLDLMRTQSDHRLLTEGRRERLLSELGRAIEGAGGKYRVGYLCLLYLARSL